MNRRIHDASSERGASATEFALVVGPLTLLLFMILEGGLLLQSNAGLGAVVSVATRAGSIAGDEQLADYRILQAIDNQRGTTDIVKIVVFNASPGDSGPPMGCLSAGSNIVGSECNLYTATDLKRAPGSFVCAGNDANWCAIDRKTGIADPDYVGVHIEAKHELITGFIRRTVILGDTAILPIEDPS